MATSKSPFIVHSASLLRPRAAAGVIELELVQGTQQKSSAQGELLAKKVYTCVTRKTLMRSERLRALLPAEPVTTLRVHVPDEGLSVEAISSALSWQALPAEERQGIEHVTWQSMCSLLQAAAWLGCAPLLAACEATLCELLRLDNVRDLMIRAAARTCAPSPPLVATLALCSQNTPALSSSRGFAAKFPPIRSCRSRVLPSEALR